MEERINLIKSKLSDNHEENVEYLKALFNAQNKILEDTLATIEAINIVLDEITKEEVHEEVEEAQEVEEIQVSDEELKKRQEIDELLDQLKYNVESQNQDEALEIIEKIIPKIEEISKSDDENVIYCSFSTEFEKMIFENIFAGEKKVIDTPYSNDVVYIMYANILLDKKRKKAAMDALDRAIYWNFLNREAREKKIDLYFSKQEIVKCLDAIKKLQKISYTAQDIADCYNKYAYVFNSLKDMKSAYALYRLSYSYYQNEEVLAKVRAYEDIEPSYKELAPEEILQIAHDNEVDTEPNSKIIKAHRDITSKLITAGAIKEAKIMIENDYAMTRDEEIIGIYNDLNELENQRKQIQSKEDNNHQDENNAVEENIPKKRVATRKRTATKK